MVKRAWHTALLAGLLIISIFSVFAGDDLIGLDGNTEQYTGFSNLGSIINTRHNLTQSSLTSMFGGAAAMAVYRNDYGEVCVYCHTPHGASANGAVPLWNRNILATAYTTYDSLGTSSITQPYSQPGSASLTCLSCHDGRQAVDAIINMPGSGRYNPTPSSAAGTGGDLYKRWNVIGKRSLNHGALTQGVTGQECLSCHDPAGLGVAGAVDFTLFALGTDLSNDHPVGVTYPATNGSGTDWNTPGGTNALTSSKFFDANGDGRMQKNEIRLYNSGAGPEVECASCHDPHGVPSGGTGSPFNKSFLRKSNAVSDVCLTCHAK